MIIVYEDPFIIVAIKPTNMPSQNDKTGDIDMLSLVKKHAYTKYRSQNVWLVHRLDRGVGGLMVFAQSAEICSDLQAQFGKSFKKEYLAVTCGKPPKVQDQLINYVVKNERQNISKVVESNFPNSKDAHLFYAFTKETNTHNFGTLALLKVTLTTGRHHQIRLQLSHAGAPLWGDTKYNSDFDKGGKYYKEALAEDVEILPALWAAKVQLKHPKNGRLISQFAQPDAFPFSLF